MPTHSTRDSSTGHRCRGNGQALKGGLHTTLQETASSKRRQTSMPHTMLMRIMRQVDNYQPVAHGYNFTFILASGNHRRRLTGGSGSMPSNEGTQKYPGNTPNAHRPHPPSKMAPPPGIRSRLLHVKRPEYPDQHNSPERSHHSNMPNGFANDQGHPHPESTSRTRHGTNTRRIRSRNETRRNDSYQNSIDGSSNDEEQPQKQQMGDNRITSLHRYAVKPPIKRTLRMRTSQQRTIFCMHTSRK